MARFSSLLSVVLLAACNGDKGFVVYNTPPAVTILQPIEGAVFEQGEAIDFLGQAVDDGDVTSLTVQWASSIDNVLPDPNPPDAMGVVSFVTSNLSVGTHVITLRAIDTANQQGEARVSIEVGEGVLPVDEPTIEIISPSAGAVGIDGEPFTFAARVDDANDAPEELIVELTSNTAGFVCFMVPNASGNGTCQETLSLGSHLLSFTVTDTDGFTTTRNVVFEVVDRGDADLDGDGHTPNGGDCNDSAATIYPGAPEICDNLDNDCDPLTPIDVNTACYDDDGDDYCELPPCRNASGVLPDCNDANPNAYPGAPEVQNLIDDNCDGRIDEGFSNYDNDLDGYCATPPCTNSSNMQPDCDDTNATIHPAAVEVCGDGVDNNCDGLTNEQNAQGCSVYFSDNDQDGFGAAPSACWCEPQYPFTSTTNNDCDDSSGLVFPGQTAWFNAPRANGSFDYNCDGTTTLRYSTGGATCAVSGLGCSGSSNAYVGAPPACGQNGTFQTDCGLDVGALLLGCGLSCGFECAFGAGSACFNCLGNVCLPSQICDQDIVGRIQECN